jgi:hypothetical protein
MRGLKCLRSAARIATGHAFVQNLRRGHYELATDAPSPLRLVAAFTELAQAGDQASSGGTPVTSRRMQQTPTSPGMPASCPTQQRPPSSGWLLSTIAVLARARLAATQSAFRAAHYTAVGHDST